MSDYRRVYVEGGTYFFTVVTSGRIRIFDRDAAVRHLRACFREVMAGHPFTIDAIVVLPDHIHAIWTLPEGDSDFSTRWRLVKGNFSRRFVREYPDVASRCLAGCEQRAVWQDRFWEHLIRDEEDFERHCDYIHYNPVKHGLARSPAQWKHSSSGLFVGKGIYPPDWGESVGGEVAGMGFE